MFKYLMITAALMLPTANLMAQQVKINPVEGNPGFISVDDSHPEFWRKLSVELAARLQQNDQKPGTISIAGSGVVTAEPDEGYVNFGVITKAESTSLAVRENALRMTAVYEALKEKGIERNNIQTTQFHVQQAYKLVKIKRQRADGTEYDDQEQVPDGYRVTNTINVTICELASLGEVIDAVSNAANQINSISFGSSKASEYQMEARKQAVQNAKEKAEILTSGLGVSLSKVTNIAESQNYGRQEMAYGSQAMLKASDATTPVSGGSLTFSVDVNVTWEISQ